MCRKLAAVRRAVAHFDLCEIPPIPRLLADELPPPLLPLHVVVPDFIDDPVVVPPCIPPLPRAAIENHREHAIVQWQIAPVRIPNREQHLPPATHPVRD